MELDRLEGLGGEWGDFPEAAELQKQMATLEEKITNFKQEIVNEDDDENYLSNIDPSYVVQNMQDSNKNCYIV